MPNDEPDIKKLFDEAKPELKAAVRPKQPTAVDGLLAPSEGSAPMPPERPSVPRPRPKAVPGPVIVDAEPSYEDTFNAREAETRPVGRRRPEPVNYPSVAPVVEPIITPSTMASMARVPLGRLLVVIAASGAALSGVIAATGAAVVNIIMAIRPPSNADIQKRLEGIETRVNGDFGMKLETQTRQEKDAALEKRIERVEGNVKRLSNSIPAKVKVQVNPKVQSEEEE